MALLSPKDDQCSTRQENLLLLEDDNFPEVSVTLLVNPDGSVVEYMYLIDAEACQTILEYENDSIWFTFDGETLKMFQRINLDEEDDEDDENHIKVFKKYILQGTAYWNFDM